MTDPEVETVTRVLTEHREIGGAGRGVCRVCGPLTVRLEAHQAAEVVAALDLPARDRSNQREGVLIFKRQTESRSPKATTLHAWLQECADRIEAE